MSKLLNSSDDDEDTGQLNINESYATSYNRFREKEQFQKLKDKYGEEAAKKELNGNDDDSDDESSSSEDEEAEALTEQMEKDFFKTMAYLKSKDPKIYDGKTTFFEETEMKPKDKSVKEKPLYLGDMERKVILEKGGEFDEIADDQLKVKSMGKSYVDEMHELKESFKKAHEDESEEEDSLLKPKIKTDATKSKEEDDYKKWLAGQKVEIKDEKTKKELSGLRDFWTNKNLDKDEKFLRDYILKKGYLEEEEDNIESKSQEDLNLSEDEKTLEVQEEFEHKYNFRFEEPDQDFIKRYPRTMLLQDTMRKKDNSRKRKREEVAARKLEEKQKKREELKQLKALKRKEIADKIRTLQKVVGNKDFCPFKEQDIDDDFDPAEYDKRMSEVFANYNDENEDIEKPVFSDLSDAEYEDELEVENWDEWTGNQIENNANANDSLSNDFSEVKNDNATTQDELIEASSSRRIKKSKKSKFAELLEKEKPLFDPNDKTFEKYLDEYYKLDYEDLIGDMPVRFKYRQVKANDFGLSTDEVLSAPDRELNAWSSLKKTCSYRDDNEELRDIDSYKSKGKDIQLKRKILPSIFSEDGPENALVAEKEKRAEKSKTRRRQKKKQGILELAHEDTNEPESKRLKETPVSNERKSIENINGENISKSKRRRMKKKKKMNINNDGQNNLISDKKGPSSGSKFNKSSAKPTVPKKNEINAEMRMSDKRMEAYGISSNTFKRKKMKERYRQGTQ